MCVSYQVIVSQGEGISTHSTFPDLNPRLRSGLDIRLSLSARAQAEGSPKSCYRYTLLSFPRPVLRSSVLRSTTKDEKWKSRHRPCESRELIKDWIPAGVYPCGGRGRNDQEVF